MTRLLVDSDSIVYAAGFSVQKTVEGVVTAEPVGFGCHLAGLMVESIKTAALEDGLEFDRPELFLTGKGNHRDAIATIRGYKSGRAGKARPVHYDAIRDYLVRRWDAIVVDNWEADDELAMQAHAAEYDPEKLVIASIDKDLMTVPGRLYHGRRKTWYYITAMDAFVNFYRQCLTGDTVDSIMGCYKVGPTKAETVIVHGMTETEMYEETLREYEESLGRKGCPYAEMGAAPALLENARLLHLLRTPTDRWLPPGERR